MEDAFSLLSSNLPAKLNALLLDNLNPSNVLNILRFEVILDEQRARRLGQSACRPRCKELRI